LWWVRVWGRGKITGPGTKGIFADIMVAQGREIDRSKALLGEGAR